MIKFQKRLNRVLELFLVVLMSVLVVDVLWQVISRYLLSSPSSFTDELAGFLLIWVGVLGAAYVAGRREHLAIDIVLQRSPPAGKQRLQILIYVMIFLFALSVMVVGGIILMYTRFILRCKVSCNTASPGLCIHHNAHQWSHHHVLRSSFIFLNYESPNSMEVLVLVLSFVIPSGHRCAHCIQHRHSRYPDHADVH